MSFLKNLMSKIKDKLKTLFKKKNRGINGGSTVFKYEGINITNRDYISYSRLDKTVGNGLKKIRPRNKVIKKSTLKNFMENSGGNKRKKLMIRVVLGLFFVLLILSVLFSYMFMLVPLFLFGFLAAVFFNEKTKRLHGAEHLVILYGKKHDVLKRKVLLNLKDFNFKISYKDILSFSCGSFLVIINSVYFFILLYLKVNIFVILAMYIILIYVVRKNKFVFLDMFFKVFLIPQILFIRIPEQKEIIVAISAYNGLLKKILKDGADLDD